MVGKKTGGIKKGGLHQKTRDWNEISETFKGGFVCRMVDIMEKSDDETFAKHFKDLISYFAPQMQRIEAKVETAARMDLSGLSEADLTLLEDLLSRTGE